MTALLERLAPTLAQADIWALPLAFFTGALTSLLPCSLSTLPLVIGYVGGARATRGKALRLSLTFALGAALTFTALGAAAGLMGRFLGAGGSWWYLMLGALMVLMALQTWELIELVPASYLTGRFARTGYFGALLAGLLGGLFSSPCATPALVVLLGLVAGRGSLLWGIALLFCYGLGHGALAVLAGASTGWVRTLTKDPRYGRVSAALRLLLGLAMLALAGYMFWLGLT